MKITKLQFASVAVDENMVPRVAFYAFDEHDKRYLLLKRWFADEVVCSDDYKLVMKSVNKETREEIDSQMNEICNEVMKALENVI